MPLASEDYFEEVECLNSPEIVTCPVDHIPQHLFPEELGAITQIAFQLLDVYEIRDSEEVSAFIEILILFASGYEFVYSTDVKEYDVFFTCDFPVLSYLAEDDAISFFKVKAINYDSIELGPVDVSEFS